MEEVVDNFSLPKPIFPVEERASDSDMSRTDGAKTRVRGESLRVSEKYV